MPGIGTIAQCIRCVFVDRGDAQSRETTFKLIKERQQEREQDPFETPNLLLFPEGTTTNNTTLIPFKKGAFAEGHSVQPIGLKYSSGSFQPSHDVIPILGHALLLCS